MLYPYRFFYGIHNHINPTEKNQHLLKTREKLARLKQIIPLLEQQIQEQLND